MHYLLTVLFFLTTLATFAQQTPNDTFTRDWKRADSLAATGLRKSALEIANRVYDRAKANRNNPQLVKAALYRLAYQPYATEDTYAEAIESLRRDVANTPAPARNILQSVLAETYWKYYQQNRWKFQNRATSDRSSNDPRVWDLRQLVAETMAAYEASLAPAELLKKTPVSAFDVVVKRGDDDARALRPTLYDFLAHRALAFYQDTEPDIVRPANRFTLDKPAYLASTNSFAKQALITSDSLSLKFRALRLYQALAVFHQNEPNALALADVDAARLAFVHRYSTVPRKDSLYQQALETQIAQHKNQPAELRYGLALATFWTDLGDKPNPANFRRKAADLTADLLKRFPNAGVETVSVKQLLDRLNARSIALTVEEGLAPDQPILASVAYRNVPTLYYRIVRTSVDYQKRIDKQRYQNEDVKRLTRQYLSRPLAGSGSVKLPDNGDLNDHRTEIALPALPLGHYVVLTSPNAELISDVGSVSYTQLVVTNHGYLVGQKTYPLDRSGKADKVSFYDADPKLYVMDRQTGQPQANVRVDLMERYYPNNGAQERNKGTFRTDKSGGLIVPNTTALTNQYYQNRYYRIIAAGDTIETEEVRWAGRSNYNTENEGALRVLFFTDRAIYRPGQPIFFKGVLYKGKDNDFRVAANEKTEATLTDANGEKVQSLTLTSNDFGTVDGQFTAPVGRLTGSMRISIANDGTSIRVEEYKRPTFEVTSKPVTGSYKLGQPVSVSAIAKTFSGAVVDGASVRYRVVRRLQPRWLWWAYDGYSPRIGRTGPETEVGSGTLTTDATGAVSLTFAAQPDPTVDRITDPTFNFTVSFDVTDGAGETRSVEQTLGIGYSALTAKLDLPAQVDNRDRTAVLRVTNAGGQTVPVTGQLVVSKLQQPNQPLRQRLWDAPDRFALSKAAFKKLFPNDAYADEDQLPNWPKAAPTQTTAIGTSDTLKLDLSRYAAGVYAADIRVTDAAGESATLTQYFTVTTDAEPLPAALPNGWIKAVTETVKPGQLATLLVTNAELSGTGQVLMRVLQAGLVREERWLTVGTTPERVVIPVTDAQVGGFVVSFTKIWRGRVYDASETIAVPMPDKKLTIETLTFRDHLKPGEPEQWTLRIGGPDKDKFVAQRGFAEAVATLYDASLDAFVPVRWPGSPYSTPYQSLPRWSALAFNTVSSQLFSYNYRGMTGPALRQYDQLNLPNVFYLESDYMANEMSGGGIVRARVAGVAVPAPRSMVKQEMATEASMADAGFLAPNVVELAPAVAGEPKNPNKPIMGNPRRNFNETAFFFPKLQTDAEGRILLNFTMPEALTRWRLLAFAHTPDLKTGSLDRTVVTQKELMITANPPRFLREGDTLRLTARVNNLTERPVYGTANLLILDAQTGKSLGNKMGQLTGVPLMIAPGLSSAVSWKLFVPPGLENVTFRVSAQADAFTDAEERTVPVLPNRLLVLDSQPFYVNGNSKKTVRLDALAKQSPEVPLSAERLTVELTSNPVWTALQSLPYLTEYPYECAEQLFSRFYANALASRIVNARPDIRAVAEQWAKQVPANPLETNKELKSVTLDETPWRRSARSQTEQQAKIGRLLADSALMAGQVQSLMKLQQLQTSNGGFMWFSGMPVDRMISLHVLSGFGHLAKLGVTLPTQQQQIATTMIDRAQTFADQEAKQWLEQQKQEKSVSYGSFWPVQYLYARSFYTNKPIADKAVRDELQRYVTKNWQQQSIYQQALTALAVHRMGDKQTPASILQSLTERAAQSDELGMYWPDNRAGYFWQQAPVETEAILIEAYSEIAQDAKAVNAMKQWLLSQKRLNAWPSTKATTEAIYALLLNGDDWLNTANTAELEIGGKQLEAATDGPTGYQKVTYQPADIKPEMGVVTVRKTDSGPAWGGIYYQHFEPFDKVTPSSDVKEARGNLTVTKQLFVQRDSPAGPVSTPVTAKTTLKPGDKLLVRVEVRNDRAMQYVHLKDSRASGFEPLAALSGYKYQNGLGYYEAPRDASNDFFLSSLPAGTHVFEYGLRVVHTGNFATGVATIQCFYAPEFSAYSAGGRVHVATPEDGR